MLRGVKLTRCRRQLECERAGVSLFASFGSPRQRGGVGIAGQLQAGMHLTRCGGTAASHVSHDCLKCAGLGFREAVAARHRKTARLEERARVADN